MTRPAPRHRPGFTLYELLIILGMGSLLFALFLPAAGRARLAAARSQSANNLKVMGIATIGIASRREGLLRPSSGKFPAKGPNAPIFFHMLNEVLQGRVFDRYVDDPSKPYEPSAALGFLCLVSGAAVAWPVLRAISGSVDSPRAAS